MSGADPRGTSAADAHRAGWADARRVLCIRLDSLGDVLMTTPALRALREALPGRRLTLLTSPSGAAAAPLVPEIDDTIVFEAPWMKPGGASPAQDAALIERLAAQRFDAAVVFTVYSQNPLPAAYLAWMAGIPLRLAHCRENPYQLLTDWVRDPEPLERVRHEVRRQLDLVAAVGARTDDERLSLAVPPAARGRTARLLAEAGLLAARDARTRAADTRGSAPLVLVHPGATAASRRWPPERFAQVARALVERGCRIAFTGSAEEAELIERIRAQMGEAPAVSLAGRLALDELAAAIESADLLLVNNTGPAHLAAALGTPVLVPYALTNPQHTPWSASARVLFHDVPCRNCYRSACPAGHHRCLLGIEADAVIAAATALLASAPARPVPGIPMTTPGAPGAQAARAARAARAAPMAPAMPPLPAGPGALDAVDTAALVVPAAFATAALPIPPDPRLAAPRQPRALAAAGPDSDFQSPR